MNNKRKKINILYILSAVLALICISMFVFIVVRYKVAGGFKIDQFAIDFSAKIQSETLTNIFKLITHFGSIITIGAIALALIIVIKPVIVKVFLVVNIAFSGLFCLLVKYIVQRPRPTAINLINETGFSFPSAHAMISIAFYGFIIFLVWRYLKNKPIKIVLTILLPLFALFIAYSRVYLGVHYFSDILAGIMAGLTCLLISTISFINIEKSIKKKRGKK